MITTFGWGGGGGGKRGGLDMITTFRWGLGGWEKMGVRFFRVVNRNVFLYHFKLRI